MGLQLCNRKNDGTGVASVTSSTKVREVMVDKDDIDYVYPVPGEKLESYQPGLEFYNEKTKKWVPSGVVTATMRDAFTGLYRKRKEIVKEDV
jgi:hypothetical protein